MNDEEDKNEINIDPKNFRYKDDPVFLLSLIEYKSIKDIIPNVHKLWWLRSLDAYGTGHILCVDASAGVDTFGYDPSFCDKVCLRPAFNLDYISRDAIECYGIDLIMISDKIAVARSVITTKEGEICHFPFSISSQTDYEKSTIRLTCFRLKEAIEANYEYADKDSDYPTALKQNNKANHENER